MTATTTADKVSAAKAANEATQAPKIAAAQAARAAAKASRAKQKATVKLAVDKTICRWGQGRYHSPANAKSCTNAKAPKKELCAEHEIAMRAAVKASRPAKVAKPKLVAVKKATLATMESEIAAVKVMQARKSTPPVPVMGKAPTPRNPPVAMPIAALVAHEE
jgi:hypothetical protein